MELPPPPPPTVPQPADAPPAGPSTGMESPESKKRVRQPRNSACSACAQLKMKCVRVTEGGACERCVRMKVECQPALPKPRKRREGEFVSSHGSTSAPGYDENSTPINAARTLPSPAARPASVTNVLNTPRESPASRGNLHHLGSKSFTALLAEGLGLVRSPTPSVDLLRGIDANSLVSACTVFRQYSQHFPFVSIPLQIDGVAFASQRPLTTLAVCAVTSAADRAQQDRLDYAFRLALSVKVHTNGDRSVDLLAGLLIHLTWNHHYMSREQIYQHLCLLAGMTVDCGLYKNLPRSDITDAVVTAELNRCFVGAYFLCSLVPPFAFNKHNPMRWTDNLRHCADKIVRAGESASDRGVASLVELAAAVDNLQTFLQTDVSPSTSKQCHELQAKATGQRLRALKRDYQPLSSDSVWGALHLDLQYKQMQSSGYADPSILIQCACCAKEYFDDLMSRPSTFLQQATIVDWVLLLHATVLTFRLTKQAAHATSWEQGALTSMLQPEQTMEKLLNHMASAPSDDPLRPKHDGLLHWLHSFVQNSKNILLSDAAGSAQHAEASEGRFRPMPSEAVPLNSRPLPYQAQDRTLPSQQSPGVLDQDFWRHLRNGD